MASLDARRLSITVASEDTKISVRLGGNIKRRTRFLDLELGIVLSCEVSVAHDRKN